ncbi:hypothetical protein [Pseudalkalibacillus berkeleyi]|uniref:Type IV pilus assembly protein PilN n=1 Tax=Pseudalkalibacillus berkeleyi TaxID=1069813 RepID=A0ABS9GZC4_9BACL|nr:hypothetical protein [Pseudalkalibacillus berkeleyi]MCF6138102.1 hypothetical protein [Pseudalkalibacillus berkeleyi]
MQVDINLLPKKRSGLRSSKVAFMIVITLFMFCSIGIGSIYYISSQNISQLEADYKAHQSQTERLQVQLSEINENGSSSVGNEFESLVGTRVETIKVIDHILKRLPAGGLLNISYAEDGNVNVMASFKSLEDVAAYQKQLVQAEGMYSIELLKLNQQESEDASTKSYIANLHVKYEPLQYLSQGGTR